MTYTVYILYSSSGDTIYIGYTSDLIKRFYSHNIYGKDWSKRFRPWVVIYAEYFTEKKDATVREKQLKGAKARVWIWEKIKSEFPAAGFISA